MALTPLAEVQAMVLGAAAPRPIVQQRLADTDAVLGLVLAEDVVATEAVPPFANTAMDGFAVRAADTAGATADDPVGLRIVGFLPAGQAPTTPVGYGQAVRIMTGAPIPEGADAIVMVERTSVDPTAVDVVKVHHAASFGDHVRPAGEDVAPGQTVFAAGTELTGPVIGVLASLGRVEVACHRRPIVGVLSTGDELVSGGGPLGLGQIRESNRPALLALCRASGFGVVDLGIAPDTEAAITAALERGAAECDAVLTTGGVSMGDVDLVKVILDRLSDETFQWLQVAIKPAKPFAFGTVRGVPVFGLPGNPVSSLVSFECFARPSLRRMAGHPDARLGRPTVRATAIDGLRRRPDGKIHLERVVCPLVDGHYVARSTGAQGSNILTSLALADGIAVLPDGNGIEPGGDVDVWLLR